MSDPFVHLHVASGYSLRHGASHPHVLVGRAGDHGMDTLALTDRDGVYGAVRFVKACRAAGIRPVLGVDLAVEPCGSPARARASSLGRPAPTRSRTPVRGGAFLSDGHPRVTVLAVGKAGWAALCRLVSATHARGERGRPVTTLDMLAAGADQAAGAGGGLVVLLGPGSEAGWAVGERRPDVAATHLARWRSAFDTAGLVVEVVHHRGPGEAARAARLAGLAVDAGIPVVLTNAVRYADRADGPVADVLDAARRLVVLDSRHVDRVNAEGYLKSGKEMAELAEEVARGAGLPGL